MSFFIHYNYLGYRHPVSSTCQIAYLYAYFIYLFSSNGRHKYNYIMNKNNMKTDSE